MSTKKITQQNLMINQYANYESHTVHPEVGCNSFSCGDKLNF